MHMRIRIVVPLEFFSQRLRTLHPAGVDCGDKFGIVTVSLGFFC